MNDTVVKIEHTIASCRENWLRSSVLVVLVVKAINPSRVVREGLEKILHVAGEN